MDVIADLCRKTFVKEMFFRLQTWLAPTRKTVLQRFVVYSESAYPSYLFILHNRFRRLVLLRSQ